MEFNYPLALRRNRFWEAYAVAKLKGQLKQHDCYGNARLALECLPVDTKLIVGLSTTRYKDGCFPTDYITLEHAWCRLPSIEVVDVSWPNDEGGKTHYYDLIVLGLEDVIAEDKKQKQTDFFNTIKNYDKEFDCCRKDALHDFALFDRLSKLDKEINGEQR